MSRYLKLIWFFEDDWTKYHAAVGINARKTLCGIERTNPNRPILPKEKLATPVKNLKCLKCLAALRHRYGYEDIREVKVD